MAKTGQDDTFYAYNKRILKFTITDEDVVGEPAFSLVGYTLKWSLSRLNSDGTWESCPTLIKDESHGVAVTNYSGGLVSVTLTKADTEFLEGSYYHELEIFDGVDEPLVVSTGTLTLLRNVINP